MEPEEFTKQPYVEEFDARSIESIEFSTFSEAEILNLSKVNVWRCTHYDEPVGMPVHNGILDLRLGALWQNDCRTCGASFRLCPGHNGHIKLILPVYNIGFLSTVIDIMTCICKNCSRILINENERLETLQRIRESSNDLKKQQMVHKFVERCNRLARGVGGYKCKHCGYINGVIMKKPLGIMHHRSRIEDGKLEEFQKALKDKKVDQITILQGLNAKMALELLKKMSDEDCELFCLNGRPENLIIKTLLVPPTAIRCWPVGNDDDKCSIGNGISERLKLIIQANASLYSKVVGVQTGSDQLWTCWERLTEEVARYINSDVPGLSQQSESSSRPLRGFVQRLKEKRGRFRYSLTGKRVEFIGRTVITTDPNLKITEVGIPVQMALTLTYPERVSQHNFEKLQKCIRNGYYKYPGALYMQNHNGQLISLRYAFRKQHANDLRVGSIVHRHLEDGDVVLINRQPSLHRMSIMSHQARIMPWRTLRFNPSVCNPYNACFDGDEINLHVPQTEEARTEALMLLGVQNNLCTPKNGEVLVASTGDMLTSSFLITRKDSFYDRSAFSQILSFISDDTEQIYIPPPALVKPVELWTGKQLFSVLLNPHVFLNLTVAEESYGNSKETMCPKDGFVCVYNSELISGQLGKATLGSGQKGGIYSILLRDYGPHAASSCMNRLTKLSAWWIGNHGFSIGIDDVQPGDRLSKEKKAVLDESYGHCTDYVRSYTSGSLEPLPGCNYAETLEAKITGTLNNIQDTTANVCMKNLNWRNSPLIMSQCGSKGSPSNICQMVACVGQQSVGGCRAPNGFSDRTLPHFETGASDPDAKGFIQNSFYTGLSATEFFFNTMAGREILVNKVVKTSKMGYVSHRLIKAMEDLAIGYDKTVRDASGSIVQFVYGDDAMDPALTEEKLPLNFERLLMKAKAIWPAERQEALTPRQIEEVVNETMDRELPQSSMTFGGGGPQSYAFDSFAASLRIFIESKFPSSVCVPKLGAEISQQQLTVFLDTCFSSFRYKEIDAGTPVGVIGAQSIGESGAQMTIASFHHPEVARMNVTSGVKRTREIVTAARRISTPIINAVLQSNTDAATVKMLIQRTFLHQVATIQIVHATASAKVILNIDKINHSLLPIDAISVRESILRTTGRRQNQELQIIVHDSSMLEVYLPNCQSRYELHQLKSKLAKVVVKGIKSVKGVTIINEANGNAPGQNRRSKLVVEGTGLLSVMGTEGVDGCKTTSNHIWDVQQSLGIEAARMTIINELQHTVSRNGMSIDIRHLKLLADTMTFKGEVQGMTTERLRDSVLKLAPFKKKADDLFNAAVHGRVEKIEGVSKCIITGVPMKIGTGMFNVMQTLPPFELNYAPDPIIR